VVLLTLAFLILRRFSVWSAPARVLVDAEGGSTSRRILIGIAPSTDFVDDCGGRSSDLYRSETRIRLR